MNQSHIILLPDVAQKIEERKRIRQAFTDTQNNAAKVNALIAQVPNVETGIVLAQPVALTSEQTPPYEVAAVIPLLEQELSTIQRLEADMRQRYADIEEIKRKARNLLYTLIGSGAVAALILIFILLHVVLHVF